MNVFTLDLGSTWTKGAAFDISGGQVRLLRRAARPTTVADLSKAFFEVLQDIAEGQALQQLRTGQARLHYSSSAKGGLAVAALGLVPEVTLELGKVAAQSAGAKLTQVHAYHLTRQDVLQLEKAPPDILLFAGGTDGGNTEYVLANARALAASQLNCDIVYAGNRAVADEVATLLAGKRLHVVDNLLPSFDEPSPEAAREAIRQIFLSTIVKGKGLDGIVASTGAAPVPTPLAVLEYTQAIRQHVPGWDDFILLDMGGATTDVYSAHTEAPPPGTVLRGLPEPEVKRTVEGDLGLRVSAQAVCRVEGRALQAELAAAGIEAATLQKYTDHLSTHPDALPRSALEERLDALLASVCIGQAVARHAGRATSVFTPEGAIRVQTGRDLTQTPRVIGSGGWLARAAGFNPAACLARHTLDARGRQVLLPASFAYHRDEPYLFPLLANLARECPAAAAQAGVALLTACN